MRFIPEELKNMAQEFDDSFKELEQSIMEDMKKVYSEKRLTIFSIPEIWVKFTPLMGLQE